MAIPASVAQTSVAIPNVISGKTNTDAITLLLVYSDGDYQLYAAAGTTVSSVAAASVAVPNVIGSVAAGSLAVPNVVGSVAAASVAVPNVVGSVSAASVAVPNSITSVAQPAVPKVTP